MWVLAARPERAARTIAAKRLYSKKAQPPIANCLAKDHLAALSVRAREKKQSCP
jgi:hypothetical protein